MKREQRMKKKIKLIALDLDGTLLTSEKRVSGRTLEVLKECERRGIEIVPTTGRAKQAAPDFVLELPGVHYGIFVNGASIWDLKKQEELFAGCIDWKTAQETARMLRRYPILFDLYLDGKGVCERSFLDRLEAFGVPEVYCRLIRESRIAVDDLSRYLEQTKAQVQKMNLIFPEGNLQVRHLVRAELEKQSGLLVTSSLPWNLELNAAGVTKGSAVLRLAGHLKLPIGETMACGDGENDLSMLQTAGFGVAMENGASFLKEHADWITLSNDCDGVAEAIKRWVLE